MTWNEFAAMHPNAEITSILRQGDNVMIEFKENL